MFVFVLLLLFKLLVFDVFFVIFGFFFFTLLGSLWDVANEAVALVNSIYTDKSTWIQGTEETDAEWS